jgi:hypothetical protein
LTPTANLRLPALLLRDELRPVRLQRELLKPEIIGEAAYGDWANSAARAFNSFSARYREEGVKNQPPYRSDR